MRKAINRTLLVFVISTVIISAALMFSAYYAQIYLMENAGSVEAVKDMGLGILPIMLAVIVAAVIGVGVSVLKRLTKSIIKPIKNLDIKKI